MAALIRPPRPADAAELGALHDAVWRHAYTELLPAGFFEDLDDGAGVRRWSGLLASYDAQGRGPEGNQTLVAEVDGEIVGFGTAGPPRDEDPPAATELWALYVAAERHGTGVGHALLTAVLPPGPAYLWVLRGNARATRFYERHGFALTDQSKPHPATGVEERQMVRAVATAGPTPW